jgi:hypothetical protein
VSKENGSISMLENSTIANIGAVHSRPWVKTDQFAIRKVHDMSLAKRFPPISLNLII